MPAAPSAPTAPPPSASQKPAGVTIIDTPPPKPPPAPTSTIRVSEMPSTAAPATPPKKGSAMQRMREALQATADKKVSAQSPSPGPIKAPEPPASTVSEPSTLEEGESPRQPESPSSQTDQPEPSHEPAAEPATKGEKPKASPWKLVDQYKSQNANLQKEIADLRAKITPETDRKTLMERAEKAESLAKQLSDEIRYHNYEKSPEFSEQFHAPYEAAFRRALEDLSEVSVTDEATGLVRKMTGDDLAQLAFMNFAQAKEVAKRLFPDFENDIMSARKEIRSLWEKRQAALKDWKEKGSQREQQQIEQRQKMVEEVGGFIRQTWEKANADVLADEKIGTFFKPVDGDDEWNGRLQKGFELVDRSYAENPANPELTPQQRADAVKRHAAVRARAAGWGALRYRNEQLQQKISALEKELEEYKSTTPATTGSETAPPASTAPGTAMDRMRAELRKMAH